MCRLPIGIGLVVSRGVDQQEAARIERGRRREGPLVGSRGVIGEVPAAEVEGRGAGVEDLDPVVARARTWLAIGYQRFGLFDYAAVVGGHELVDDQLAHVQGGETRGAGRPGRAGAILREGAEVVGGERTEPGEGLEKSGALRPERERAVPATAAVPPSLSPQ